VGVGWTHNYAARLAPVVNSAGSVTRIRVYRPNGAIQTFQRQGNQWVGDADVPERLNATFSGGLLQSATYQRRDDSVETYDQHGRLTSIRTRDGHTQTFSYATASGRSWLVQQVADPQGRTLQFSYNSVGQLASLTASDGTTITYSHSGNNLVSATYPASGVRTYHYNEAGQTGGISQPHALTGITDENGKRYAS